ncbi:Trans-resveratrol di-O-methyltransferase [Vitis vinifera]|uniref:Trans-resveratrol di-O-methyltransferase n=1 Tax=Vitis vinifera TaxID=29760 RepID=A0A438EG71_VITVI|nr:Trans-resveratrol di-O-methyltransferase [Vitis vinifera]
MDWPNSERSSELLHAQAHVWNHIFNFINSMSLKCTCHSIRHPRHQHNHGQPMTLPEQVAELSVHPKKTRCVCRLMRILVQSGFFAAQRVRQSEQEEGYVLTNASRLLLKDDFFVTIQ